MPKYCLIERSNSCPSFPRCLSFRAAKVFVFFFPLNILLKLPWDLIHTYAMDTYSIACLCLIPQWKYYNPSSIIKCVKCQLYSTWHYMSNVTNLNIAFENELIHNHWKYLSQKYRDRKSLHNHLEIICFSPQKIE